MAKKLGMSFNETSAKDGTNVKEVFMNLIDEVLHKVKRKLFVSELQVHPSFLARAQVKFWSSSSLGWVWAYV